jgi:hypothetical protein
MVRLFETAPTPLLSLTNLLSHPKASQNVVNEMGEESHQQQTPYSTNPE